MNECFCPKEWYGKKYVLACPVHFREAIQIAASNLNDSIKEARGE